VIELVEITSRRDYRGLDGARPGHDRGGLDRLDHRRGLDHRRFDHRNRE
jgi:hypothetical protein